MIVIGVRSSWPASLMNAFWLAKAVLEPVEHLVEGAREVGQLVVALDRDAAREVGLRDRAGGVAQHAQRREHPAGHHPGEQRGEQEARRCATPAATLQRVVDLARARSRGRSRPRTTPRARRPRRDGHGQVADPAAVVELDLAARRRRWRIASASISAMLEIAAARARSWASIEVALRRSVKKASPSPGTLRERKTSKIARTSSPKGSPVRGSRPSRASAAELLGLLDERVVDPLAGAREQHLAQRDRRRRRVENSSSTR